VKDIDLLAELRAQMARQRMSAVDLARHLRPDLDDEQVHLLARRLRRQLRGETAMHTTTAQLIGHALGLRLTVEREER